MRSSLGPHGTTAVLTLRQLILDGEIRAGERLSEERLAARLGISRTPLRLALSQLRNDGLAEAAPGGGFVLRSFNSSQVQDVLELRGVLEGSAARLAAQHHADSPALAQLDRCLGALNRVVRNTAALSTGDLESFARLNADFHAELFIAAGSEALHDAYEQVLEVPFASPSAFLLVSARREYSSAVLAARQAEHRGIVEAIRRGDGETAERLTRRHAQAAACDLARALDEEPNGLEDLPGRCLITAGNA